MIGGHAHQGVKFTTLRPCVQGVEGTAALASELMLLRRDVVQALYDSGGGHYGGCLSVIDILLVLYRRVLRVDPQCPRHELRDRLILSKGHAALALYAVLRRLGYFDWPLDGYASDSSPLEGHPDMTALPGVDFSTGSLGQGLSVGLGAALVTRGRGQHTWVILGDGECQEGQVWEAAQFAAVYNVDHLTVVVDCNGRQEWGWSSPTNANQPPVVNAAAKWRAFGWTVLECNGHDLVALERSFLSAQAARGCPVVILAATIKGAGVGLIERDPHRFHCSAVSSEEHAKILASLPQPK